MNASTVFSQVQNNRPLKHFASLLLTIIIDSDDGDNDDGGMTTAHAVVW